MNARSHGIFCQDLVLTGESRRLFLRLRESLIDSLAPQDVLELMLVDRVASATWRLRRLQSAELFVHGAIGRSLKLGVDEEIDRLVREIDEHAYDNPDTAAPQEPRKQRMEMASQYVGEGDVEPSLTLAASIQNEEHTLERASMYEQRLQGIIHRSLRELRALRDAARKHGAPGPSPFGWRVGRSSRRSSLERGFEPNCAPSAESDSGLTSTYGHDARAIMENEPTAG